MQLLISVIIPLFNKRLYLKRAVSSVLNQTYKNLEIIIIDDGSTDNSLNTLEDLIDRRIVKIKQKNLGKSIARNNGIKKSSGKLILFLDADDYWYENHVYDLYKLFKLFPKAGLFSTNYLEISSEQIPSINKIRNNNKYEKINYFKLAANNIGIVWTSAAAITRDVYDNLGGFEDINIGEDLEYWARISLRYEVAYSHNISALYCRNTNGAMESIIFKTRELPKNLNDISPSVKFLSGKNKTDNIFLTNKYVLNYVNSRISNIILWLVYMGYFEEVKIRTEMLIKPLNIKFSLFYILGKNKFILINLRVILKIFKKIKDFIR